MDKTQQDDILEIGIFKHLEQISRTLVQLLILKDSLKIVRAWSVYKLEQALSVRANVVYLIQVFGFTPFRFGLSNQFIELFEDIPSLRIPREILCEETRHCVQNIRRFEKSRAEGETMTLTDSFFQARSVGPNHETFSHFRFNYIFETFVDRRLVFYQFIWNLYRFDECQSFFQHSEEEQRAILALGEFLWLCLEQFQTENISRWIQHKPYMQAISKVQELLARPESLYRYLSKKSVLIITMK